MVTLVSPGSTLKATWFHVLRLRRSPPPLKRFGRVLSGQTTLRCKESPTLVPNVALQEFRVEDNRQLHADVDKTSTSNNVEPLVGLLTNTKQENGHCNNIVVSWHPVRGIQDTRHKRVPGVFEFAAGVTLVFESLREQRCEA